MHSVSRGIIIDVSGGFRRLFFFPNPLGYYFCRLLSKIRRCAYSNYRHKLNVPLKYGGESGLAKEFLQNEIGYFRRKRVFHVSSSRLFKDTNVCSFIKTVLLKYTLYTEFRVRVSTRVHCLIQEVRI